MNARRKARAVSAASGSRGAFQNDHSKFTTKRRLLPYAKAFHLKPRQCAVVRCGWPMHQPPPAHEVALPHGESPATFDWRALAGAHVYICPAQGHVVSAGLLRELGRELIAVGAASVVAWDGSGEFSEWWRDASEHPGAQT